MMSTAKVLNKGDHQVLILPDDFNMTEQEYMIHKAGEGFLLFPKDDPWYALHLSLSDGALSHLSDREQPTWADQPQRCEF